MGREARDPVDLKQVKKVIRKLKDEVELELYEIELSRLQLAKPGLTLPPNWTPIYLPKPALFYKVVAAVNSQLLSVFDGTTQYDLGHALLSARGATAWAPLDACFYCHATPEEAAVARFPANSRCLSAPKILIQVEVKGRGYASASDVWAFAYCKPTVLLSDAYKGSSFVVPARYAEQGLPLPVATPGE